MHHLEPRGYTGHHVYEASDEDLYTKEKVLQMLRGIWERDYGHLIGWDTVSYHWNSMHLCSSPEQYFTFLENLRGKNLSPFWKAGFKLSNRSGNAFFARYQNKSTGSLTYMVYASSRINRAKAIEHELRHFLDRISEKLPMHSSGYKILSASLEITRFTKNWTALGTFVLGIADAMLLLGKIAPELPVITRDSTLLLATLAMLSYMGERKLKRKYLGSAIERSAERLD